MNKSSNNQRARRAKVKRIRLIAGLCCVAVLLIACGVIGMRIYHTHQRLKMVSGLQEMYQPGGSTAQGNIPEPTQANAPANPQVSETPVADATGAANETSQPNQTNETNPTGQPAATDAPIETAVPAAATQQTAAQSATAAPAFDAQGNPVAHADFKALLEINEHLVGWLEAADSISLPVVHYDNDFYLDHDYYGNYDSAGTVFVNEVNTVWPADKHLLLHGHNMRDGSAFGTLKEKFSKLDTLKANPLVYFRLINEAERTAYVPIAVFEASVNEGNAAYFDIGNIFFDDDADFLSYVQSATDRSIYQLPVDVQPDDHLLSLVTCSYGYDNARFVVMCRELREGETAESVVQLMQSATKK